jgi:hypothetical protein
MDKKAQIRLTETIAVLFIFFILVGLGISFYAKYQTIAFEEQREEILQAKAIRTTLKSLFLPELLCSRGDAEPEDNCIDMLKAKNFETNLEDEFTGYYFDVFSFANITLHQIYPNEQKITLYENIKPDFENKENTFFIVTLRDETKGINGIPAHGYGYIQVEVFS